MEENTTNTNTATITETAVDSIKKLLETLVTLTHSKLWPRNIRQSTKLWTG